MERLRKVDDESLLVAALQADLLNVQRLQVVIDRSHQNASKILRLTSEKKKLGMALANFQNRLSDSEKLNTNLIAEVEVAVAGIIKHTTETHELRGAAVSKIKRALELEAELAYLRVELESA